jgi:hypothetical protein
VKGGPQLIANMVDALAYAFATICRDLDCFTRTDAPCRISICSSEADETPKCLPRRTVPSPWLPRGQSPLPRTGRSLPRADKRWLRIEGHGGSLDRQSPGRWADFRLDLRVSEASVYAQLKLSQATRAAGITSFSSPRRVVRHWDKRRRKSLPSIRWIAEGEGTSDPQPLGLGGCDLVADALGGDLPFELGKGQKHIQGQTTHRGRRVEPLGDRDEGDRARKSVRRGRCAAPLAPTKSRVNGHSHRGQVPRPARWPNASGTS